MPNTPTPGQVAYEGYWREHLNDGLWHLPPVYATLQPITRASWEAAAQAVRAMQTEETHAHGARD